MTHADAFDNSSDEYCKCITITPNENYKAGSFWNETPIDLSESFEKKLLTNSFSDPKYFNIKTMQKINLQ